LENSTDENPLSDIAAGEPSCRGSAAVRNSVIEYQEHRTLLRELLLSASLVPNLLGLTNEPNVEPSKMGSREICSFLS
jgi:hypothetical protein